MPSFCRLADAHKILVIRVLCAFLEFNADYAKVWHGEACGADFFDRVGAWLDGHVQQTSSGADVSGSGGPILDRLLRWCKGGSNTGNANDERDVDDDRAGLM